ncbi:MAG: hypothetical protein GY803_04570 [Chloroflexi bacterium]|nr:hypothetical protein [Chloroflexota bacterium]
MFSIGETAVWPDRWGALKRLLDQLLADLSDPTSHALVACLDAFGESQYQFFYDGFQNGKLLPSAQYPAEYVLRTTLDQVAYDIAVIQRAVQQRGGSEKATLDKADQLAQLALNLAIDSGLLEETAVLAYFNKSSLIRTIPYAPLALVAVPYTSIAVSRDFLATPHEVGHYVYRHGDGVMADLRDLLPLQSDWLCRWQEEIFADVYGCLVAGPVIGLDFQDILFDHSLEQFMSDDGEHPIEAIRPYIYTQVLRELGFTDAANALDERWLEMLAARNNPESFIPWGDFNPVSLAEARVKLEAFTLQILNYLTDTREVAPKDYWSKDLPANEDVESLYEQFDTWVKDLPAVTVPPLGEDGDEVGVVENSELTNKRHKGDTQTWIDALKQQDSYKLPPEVWEPVLSSEGWTVAGPGQTWPPD